MVFDEPFAEVFLDEEWVKVEVIRKDGLAEGNCLVTRIDGITKPFAVKAQELTPFGSHEPESKRQIKKREDFEKLEKLLKGKECTIEKMGEDGNCLFRSVARQIYGDQDLFQIVRDETVQHVIKYRGYFSNFETDIDERLSEQLMNRSWGGNLEIAAISELYNVGVVVWELSREGRLVTPIDNAAMAASLGLKSIYLSRHWGIHYISVVYREQNLPLKRAERLPSKSWLRISRGKQRYHPKAVVLSKV